MTVGRSSGVGHAEERVLAEGTRASMPQAVAPQLVCKKLLVLLLTLWAGKAW